MGRNRRQKKLTQVRVIDIGAKGHAIGRTADGEVVLIKGPVPGDLVDIIVMRRRKGMKYCSVDRYIEYSTDRTEPFCRHFADCGGCKWQHLDYEAQTRLKAKAIRETLRRIGKVEADEFLPPLCAGATRQYRNKLEYTFSAARWMTQAEVDSGQRIEERRAAGFHPPRNFRKVVDIEECWLQREPSNQLRNFIRQYAIGKDWSFYDVDRNEGFLRTMIFRTTEDGQNMLILTFGEEDEEKILELMDVLMSRFPIDSLYYVYNPKKNDTIWDLELTHHSGERYIIEQLGGTGYRIGPKSFFQTNTKQAERLYRQVLDYADLQGDELVYDLYTGLGSIALQAAPRCREVVGIEEVPAAVEDARWNAAHNRIGNATFYTGDALLFGEPVILEKHGKPDILITDPPRAGMHPGVVKNIREVGPAKIIYVSCNPSTQARDIALLGEDYRLRSVCPVDMFPHTDHMESIALLTKPEE